MKGSEIKRDKTRKVKLSLLIKVSFYTDIGRLCRGRYSTRFHNEWRRKLDRFETLFNFPSMMCLLYRKSVIPITDQLVSLIV
jgi:hypothetical protein